MNRPLVQDRTAPPPADAQDADENGGNSDQQRHQTDIDQN
jgi:hypothetical protein